MLDKILSVSIFGLIGGLISGACSFISGAISAIGSALCSLATAALKICGSLLSGVSELVKNIGVALGFLEPEDDMDEMGYKAMNSNLSPEDFESHKAYVEALRNQPLKKEDREKLENTTEEEKLAWRGTGIALGVKGIEEDMGMTVPMEFLRTAHLQGHDKDRTMQIMENYKEGNNLKEYADYFEGKLDGQANVEAGEKVEGVYRDLNPGMSEKEIYQKVDTDMETVQSKLNEDKTQSN